MYDHATWQHSTVTTDTAQDSHVGIPLLTTGTKARSVIQLSVWTLTNTAATEIFFAIIAANPPDVAGRYYDMTTAILWSWAAPAATIEGATVTQPHTLIPLATKGYGGSGPFIIPPNSILVGYAAATADLNGTIGMGCISAELC